MIKDMLKADKKISRELFFLSLPIILSSISRVTMELIDMIMINRLGEISWFNGVSMGGMIVWIPMALAIGLRMATQTISSRRYGEKNYFECGFTLRHGLLIAFIMGSAFSLFGYFGSDSIVPLLLSSEGSQEYATIDYSKYLSIGILPFYLAIIFQGFFNSIEKTRIHMKVAVVSNILNIYLNAGLIFGYIRLSTSLKDTGLEFIAPLWFWAPQEPWTVIGSAIATTISTIFMLLYYIFFLFKDDIIEKYGILTTTIKHDKLKQHFYLAYPVIISEFFLSTSYLFFYLVLESIGQDELAAWTLIIRLAHASFMPAIGLGQGCATMVGKYLGEKDILKATKSIYEGVRQAVILMGFAGIIFIIFADPIINSFNILQGPEEYAVLGLRFCGVFQVFDAICIILYFSMSAGGDVKFPAYVEILMHWLIMVPFSWLFGVYMGYGFWGALSVFGGQVILTAIIFILRTRTGKWKEIDV
tara:strand:+ start:71 stop:1489 length:1419 start_codon:yes stop_codon:yes gene_type:complete